MDNLQYDSGGDDSSSDSSGFKPCYKWITFNTPRQNILNPPILSFKPCYKWITFNTLDLNKNIDFMTFCFNF